MWGLALMHLFCSIAGTAQDRPALLLFAHRGGVVTASSPECSLAAIRLAAAEGYDYVELDLRPSADQVPMLFHDRTMQRACGRPESVEDLTREALREVRYLANDEPIADFAEAAALCRELGLGIMLDIKAEDSTFLASIRETLAALQPEKPVFCINRAPEIVAGLRGVAVPALTEAEKAAVQAGEKPDLRGKFWFGQPRTLPSELVPRFQALGALVIPGVNTFRYDTATHLEDARADIERLMMAGVDGFQIDSVYKEFFRPAPAGEAAGEALND